MDSSREDSKSFSYPTTHSKQSKTDLSAESLYEEARESPHIEEVSLTHIIDDKILEATIDNSYKVKKQNEEVIVYKEEEAVSLTYESFEELMEEFEEGRYKARQNATRTTLNSRENSNAWIRSDTTMPNER